MRSRFTAALAALLIFFLAAPASASELNAVKGVIFEKCVREFGRAKATEKANYYAPIIIRVAGQHKLPAHLVANLIWYESNYRPRSMSQAGALGLMQVMPFHFRKGENWKDPATNINVGCRVLKDYNKRFGGNWHKTLVAYNEGPRAVSRGKFRSRYSRYVLTR